MRAIDSRAASKKALESYKKSKVMKNSDVEFEFGDQYPSTNKHDSGTGGIGDV